MQLKLDQQQFHELLAMYLMHVRQKPDVLPEGAIASEAFLEFMESMTVYKNIRPKVDDETLLNFKRLLDAVISQKEIRISS